MIEDFKIQVFDLRKEFYTPLEHLTSQTVTEENLFTIVKTKNLVMENRNKATPEIFETFLAENQSFIPHYAMNASTSNFIFDENHNIKDIEYFKRVRLNKEIGTIEWDSGFDCCSSYLYETGANINENSFLYL